MSKSYSNRALPPGTVLREWRLEEVLGVGGFGIVYKGRGIYFDELVAIKEYFPSSISERADDATVVPVDSNAEEVHALGLKKFVEEAKLLWNLSTPTRHPNIVSVRSLFEIHGTAYMVMDFEDGTPLSKLLKQGVRFNEASLKAMIIPICEGLERAHRVGVLHRDIKPPNIIVNDDGRSVLIDFGSARFESGEATSTTVTFHTPPYAAIEQYVRTYPQGPWTDIYALGVVLYECVTGSKPAEVLERVHGDAGEKLADGDWPGFSRSFLSAIDSAMALRPDERPQSIAQWLTMLEPKDDHASHEDDGDDDSTRIAGWQTDSPAIVPVAPPKKGFSASNKPLETGVPETPSRANFSARGKDEKQEAEAPAPEPKPAEPVVEEVKPPKPESPKPAPKKPSADPEKKTAGSRKLLYAGVGALAVAVAIGAAVVMDSGNAPVAPNNLDEEMASAANDVDQSGDGAAILARLSDEAQKAGISSALIAPLAPPAEGSELADGDLREALVLFSAGVAGDAERRTRALSAANKDSKISGLRQRFATLREGANRISNSADDQAAIAATHQFIANASQFELAAKSMPKATSNKVATENATEDTAATTGPAQVEGSPGVTATATPASAPAENSGAAVAASTRSEFEKAIRESRDLVQKVTRLERRDRPGSNASAAERDAYRLRQANAESAKRYDDYLNTLEASMRGTTTDAEAKTSVTKALQTKAYLRDLLNQSEQSLK